MTPEDEHPVRGFLPPRAPGAAPPRRWDVEDPETAAAQAAARPPDRIAATTVQAPSPAPGGWAPPTAPPRYAEPAPRNPGAVASLVLGILAVGGVIISVGIFAPLTLAAAVAAWVVGRRAVQRADREGAPQRGSAHAGYVLGILGVVLSALAVVVWILLLTDDAFVRELEREIERQRQS